MSTRYCRIESASVEDINGAGDGAYGLLDVEGSPKEIGRAIAKQLAEGDMSRGPSFAMIEDGDDELYLTVRIRFAKHPVHEHDLCPHCGEVSIGVEDDGDTLCEHCGEPLES